MSTGIVRALPRPRVRGLFARFFKRELGAVSPMMTLALIPVIGALAMAAEAGNWYLVKRNIQNAADAASVAAATNGDGAINGTTYISEARAVARGYGFVNATNNTSVSVTYASTGCPAAQPACYTVTISKKVPIYLLSVVGFSGNTTTSTGSRAQIVMAAAVARPKGSPTGYCMVGLGTGDAITLSGGNGTDLTGCNMASNGNMKCNGINSDDGVIYGDAVGSSNCGDVPRASSPPLDLSAFNYTTNTSLLPDASRTGQYVNPCGAASNYKYIGAAGFPSSANNTLAGNKASNWISGAVNWSGQSVVHVCGDLQITGQTTISTASSGTVLIIEDGQLSLPTATPSRTNLTTGDSVTASGLTVVFSGLQTEMTHKRYPIGDGTLNFSAPDANSGSAWKGIALYQDPGVANSDPSNKCNGSNTGNLNYCNAGNKPALNITGLVYVPNAYIKITGSIDHQEPSGLACFGLIAKTIDIAGTMGIFHAPTDECPRAGLDLPGVPGTEKRQALIQ